VLPLNWARYPIWFGYHEVIFSYKTKSAKANDRRSIDKLNKESCIPLGGTGKEGKFANT
jgi:hypothetical protein